MKKDILKKLLVGTLVIAGIATTTVNIAHAASIFATDKPTKNLQGSDQWNRGILSQSAGWYMPYSYYYNGDYNHNAAVFTQNDGLKITPVYSPGTSANINALSTPKLTNAYTRAGVQNGSWSYVYDSGSGEYK